jgi:hypothetical protein
MDDHAPVSAIVVFVVLDGFDDGLLDAKQGTP